MPEHVKVIVRGLMNGTVEWRNIFYFNTGANGLPVTSDLQTWVTSLYGCITSVVANNVNIYAVDTSDFVSNDWGVQETHAVAWAGAHNHNALPYQVAAVVIGKTSVKRVMARKFLPGFVIDMVTEDRLSTEAYSAAQAFAATWLGAPLAHNSESYTPVTWGKKHGFQEINSTRADQVYGTMRRRKLGVGI